MQSFLIVINFDRYVVPVENLNVSRGLKEKQKTKKKVRKKTYVNTKIHPPQFDNDFQ